MTQASFEVPDESILCPKLDFHPISMELHECLIRLEPLQKFVIHLRFWEELEVAQIASIIGKGWDETDHLLENTLTVLRAMIVSPERLKAA